MFYRAAFTPTNRLSSTSEQQQLQQQLLDQLDSIFDFNDAGLISTAIDIRYPLLVFRIYQCIHVSYHIVYLKKNPHVVYSRVYETNCIERTCSTHVVKLQMHPTTHIEYRNRINQPFVSAGCRLQHSATCNGEQLWLSPKKCHYKRALQAQHFNTASSKEFHQGLLSPLACNFQLSCAADSGVAGITKFNCYNDGWLKVLYPLQKQLLIVCV